MTDVTPVPIGGERVTTDDEIVVPSPYDGSEVGRVPSCGPAEVDRAVAAARARLTAADAHEPFPAHERAAVLDRAAALLAERAEQFARIIADEAAKPIRTAPDRGPPGRRHVPVQRGRGPHARRRRRPPRGERRPGPGKLGFTLRVPIGVVGAISPFNFPLNLVAPQGGARHRRRLPGRAQAGQPDPAVGAGAGEPAARRVRPAAAAGSTSSPGSGRAVGDPLVDSRRRGHDHLHRVARRWAGHPGQGPPQEGQPRAGQQHARSSSRPTATGAPPPPSSRWRGSRTPGSRASRRSGSTSTARSTTTSSPRWSTRSSRWWWAIPLDEATDVSALISRGETERVADWIAEAVAGGAKVAVGRRRGRRRRAAAHGAHRRARPT